MTAWPLSPLRPLGYRVIVADPPWSWQAHSSKGLKKSAQAHYRCMSLADIMALPVHQLAHPDGAALYLWATAPMLIDALRVMAAWGFEYKTNLCWDKKALGTGYWVRGEHELLLIGTRGKAPCPAPANRSGSMIRERRREHSRKPEAAYALIEKAHPGVARADLFSRETRPGWDAWGDQAGTFDERGAA